jgi:signal transduction histidine kinase
VAALRPTPIERTGRLQTFPLAPRTLRTRLVLAAAGSIIAAVALLAVATVVLVRRELRSTLDTTLSQRAQDVAQLAVSAPAVLTEPGALESAASGRQVAVEVIDARGRILARSLTLGARLLPRDRLARQALVAGRPGYEDVEIDGRPYRLYDAPIAQAGGPAAGGAVLVGSDTSDISRALGRLGLVVALAGTAVSLLAVLAAAVLTRRGLRPLRRLVHAAEEIERTADPARRLPETGVGDEIGQLTGVLNRMLASLEAARAGERRFLADASHELRTPVTSLLGNVEYVVRHGADAEVLEDLRRDAERLGRLVNDLLTMERSDTAVQRREPLELDQLVGDVLRSHDHADGRLRTGRLASVSVEGEREALIRVLDNLIENALVHGPSGGTVTVALERSGDRALLRVRDEGPGPDPEHGDQLFERFWRAPEASERPGSGLGLSIVSAIVRRHGGRITVEGPEFTVDLRAVDLPPAELPGTEGA